MREIAVICDCCKARGPIEERLLPALEKAKASGWRIESNSITGGNLCPGCFEASQGGKATNLEWRRMRGLLLHYHRCILIPRIARACVLSREWADKRLFKVARMLVVNGGNWSAVKADILQPSNTFPGRNKFCEWADKLIAADRAAIRGGAQ